MSPTERGAQAVYVVGGILTLGVLSLVAMNLFLSADNQQLKRQRTESLRLLAAERVCLRIEQRLRQSAEAAQYRQWLQDIYMREGLLALQINDGNGRLLFARTAVALPQEVVEQLAPDALLSLRPAPGQVLQEAVKLKGPPVTQMVLIRTILYADSLRPGFLVFALARDPGPAGMDSLEQFALLFQTIGILSLVAVGWYFLRRMIRPYERLFREIRQSPLAGGNPPSGDVARDEVSFLAESFKGVIQQLRDKERQLQDLRRQAEDRADSSEKFARDVFASLRLAILSLDAQGRFLDANPAFEALRGRARVSFINRGFADIFPDAPDIRAALESFYQDPQPRTAPGLVLPAPDGADKQISLSISPLTSPQGEFRGAVATLEDVTGEHLLRHRLQTQENLVALGEMAAGIAHELKNSLSTISGYGQMLLGNARPGAEQKRATALVQEVEEMARVISDFLEYARPLQLERAVVALDRLIEEILEASRDKHPGVSFRTSLFPAAIRGEEYLLKKVLQNLLLNALQAMDQSMEKQVDVRMEALTRQAVRLQITDTGRGMDEKTLARIFTPFFTTRPEGTGMGLAVVQKIVSLHDGTVRVYSEPGHGTTVEIDLPTLPLESSTK